MAIGISYFFTLARDEASRVAKSQIAVGQHFCQKPAVVSALVLLSVAEKVERVIFALWPTGRTIVRDSIVEPIHHALDATDLISIASDTVQLEFFAHLFQNGRVERIGKGLLRLFRTFVLWRSLENINVVAK